MPVPPLNVLADRRFTRNSFSGLYAYQIQGFLRADTEDEAYILPDPKVRPRPIEIPVALAGWRGGFPPPGVVDFGIDEEYSIRAGYYPIGTTGIMAYDMDKSVSGHHRLSIGGNVSPGPVNFDGTYELINGIEGTMTLSITTGKGTQETVSYYFILTDGDREIMFMNIRGVPNATGPYTMALGTQKRI
jgi:hypothetical protein